MMAKMVSFLWRTVQRAVFLAALLLCFVGRSSYGQSNAGRWIVDSLQGCRVYVSAPGRRIIYDGACRAGLAHGAGTVTVYGSSDSINSFYEGYFLKGYFVSKTPVTGMLVEGADGPLYLFNPRGQANYRIFSPLVPRGNDSSVCNDTIYVATNPAVSGFEPSLAPLLAERALPLFDRLCSRFGRQRLYPKVLFRFVPPSYITNGTGADFANATATWNGRAWQVDREVVTAEASPLVSGTVADKTAPVLDTATKGQGLQMAMAARIIRSVGVPYPECKVSLSIANTGGISLRGLRVQGAVLGSDKAPLVNFYLDRASQLLPGARATLREDLPGKVCNYVGGLKIDRMVCRTRAREVACKSVVRAAPPLPAVETATTEETGLPLFLE